MSQGEAPRPEAEASNASDTESRPTRIGHTEITYSDVSSLLTRTSGYLKDYDYTINPYSGCSFGCTYCYAAFFTRSLERRDTWGDWVTVKENALERLRRRRKPLTGRRIYMSSVTDPYQSVERKLRLVRSILEEIVDDQPVLVVQTRAPLVERDIDIFRRFEHVQVNMTITTDSDQVRRAFEPRCPPNRSRLRAIRALTAAGIPTAITMTPLLPINDVDAFADELLDTGVRTFVVQSFHVERGQFVANTGAEAIKIAKDLQWGDGRYQDVVARLRERLPTLTEGREGFAPPR